MAGMEIEELIGLNRPRIRWYPSSTGLGGVALEQRARLPNDYTAILRILGAGEGFIGTEYLRLYALDELGAINAAYGTKEFLPDCVIFGSTGGGEAFAFDFTRTSQPVIKVPFIPLDREFVEDQADSVRTLILDFAHRAPHDQEPYPPLVNEARIGLEVHEKKPLCLGGSPTPDNQVFVPTDKHAELSRFWTKVYKRLRDENRSKHTG